MQQTGRRLALQATLREALTAADACSADLVIIYCHTMLPGACGARCARAPSVSASGPVPLECGMLTADLGPPHLQSS